MLSVVLLCVIAQVVLTPGTTAWSWQDWWTRDGWQHWIDVYLQNDIFKDVSEDALPLTMLEIQFGDIFVYPGDVLLPTDTLLAPKVAWYCNDRKIYHLILLLLDAPVSNKGQQYVIWRIENIANCDLGTGQTIAPYNAPKPLPGTGRHRYLALMCETDSEVDQSIVGSVLKGTAGTLDFSGDDYIKKHGYVLAGNVFRVTSPIVGDVNLTPGLSGLPLGGATNVLSKAEDGIGDASLV